MQLFIDLGYERAEMQLFGELSGVEVAHRRSLDLVGINLCVLHRLLPGFGNQVSNGFSFLFQVALKIGSAAAENVNRFHGLKSELTSRAAQTARDLAKILARPNDNQRRDNCGRNYSVEGSVS